MEKVIVMIDPEREDYDQPSLDWAIARAQQRELELELLVSIPPAWAPRGAEVVQSSAPYLELVERAADIARTRTPETNVSITVRRGHPAKVILSVSRRADLVVVGGHPVGRLRGIVHGTLALQVAGRSECPVAVVPDDWAIEGTPTNRAGVVVGWTDDSTADLALAYAAREAAASSSPLRIVNSWTQPLGHDQSSATAVLDVLQDLVDGAAARTRAAHPGLAVKVEVETGSAAVRIVEAGREAELVVVGSHGRDALGSLILGSTSHDVLMNMPSPVIVVPSPDAITVLPEIREEVAS